MEGDYKVVRDKYSEENMVLNLAAETIQEAFRRYQECKPLKRIRRINSEGKLAIRLAGTTIASNIERAFINKKRLASSKPILNNTVVENTALADLLPSTKYPNLWLTIYSIDTKGLPSVKWRGDNDPYAEISLGSWISTTSTLWGGGKNCSWKNLNLTSKLKETTDSGDTISITFLNIKIFNANLAREDQIIGEAKHSLSSIKLLEKTTLSITLYDDLNKHENRRREAGNVSLEVLLQSELDIQVPISTLSTHSLSKDLNSNSVDNNYDEFYKEKDISVKKINTYLSQPLPSNNDNNHSNLGSHNIPKFSQTVPVPAPVSDHKKTTRNNTPENKLSSNNSNQMIDVAATKKSVTITSTISTAAKEKDKLSLTSSDKNSDSKSTRTKNINPQSTATIKIPTPTKEIQNNNVDNTFITSKKSISTLSTTTASKYPPATTAPFLSTGKNSNTSATTVSNKNNNNIYSSGNASTTSDSRNSNTNHNNGNSNNKTLTSDMTKEESNKVLNNKNNAIANTKLSITTLTSSETKNNNSNHRQSPLDVEEEEGNESDKISDRRKKKKLKKKRPANSSNGMTTPSTPPHHQSSLNVSLKTRYLSSVEARQIDLAMLNSMESEACTLYLRAKDVSKILKALKYVVKEDSSGDELVVSSSMLHRPHNNKEDDTTDYEENVVGDSEAELILRSFRSPALLAASLSSFARQHHLTNQPDFSVSENKASIAVLHLLTLVEGPWKKARGLIMTACETKGKAGEADGGRPSFWDAKWISRLLKALDYSTSYISGTNGQEFLKIDFMNDISTYFEQPLPSIRRTTLLIYQHLLRIIEQRWDQGIRPSDLLVTEKTMVSTLGSEEKSSLHKVSNKEQTMSSSIPGRVVSPLKFDTIDRNETNKFREGDLIQIATEDELLSAWQPYNRAYGWGINIEQLAQLCAAIEGVIARLVPRPYGCPMEDTAGLQWVAIKDNSDTTATTVLRDYQGRDFISGRNILIPINCMRTPRRASIPGQLAIPKYTPLSTVPLDKVAVGMIVMIAPIPLLLRVCERFDWWDRPVNKTLELISNKEGKIISISELASRRRIGIRVESMGIADALPVEAVSVLTSALRNSPPSPPPRNNQRPVSATNTMKKLTEDNNTANNSNSQVYKSLKSNVGINSKTSAIARADEEGASSYSYLMQECGGGDESANPNNNDDNEVEESKAYRFTRQSTTTATSLNGYGSDRSLQSVTVSAPVVTIKSTQKPLQSSTGNIPIPSGRRPLYRPVSATTTTTASITTATATTEKKSSTNLTRSLNTYGWLNPNQPISFDNNIEKEDEVTEKVMTPSTIIPKHSPKKRVNVYSHTSSTPWLSVRQAEFDSENAQYQGFETTIDDKSGVGKKTPGKLKTGTVNTKPKSPIDRLHSHNLQNLSHNTKKSRLFTDNVRAVQHIAESKRSEGWEGKESAEEDRVDFELGMGVVGSRVGGPGTGATDDDIPAAAKKAPIVRPLSANSTKTAPQSQNKSSGNKPAFGGSIPTRPLSASATRRRDAVMNSLGKKLAFLDVGNEEAMEVTRQQRLERELRRTQRDTNTKEKYLKRQLKKYGVDAKAYDSYSIV